MSIISKESSESIKNESAKIMAKLIKSVKLLQRSEYAKHFIDKIWSLTLSENSTEVLVNYTDAVSEIIKVTPTFMDEDAVNSICWSCILLLRQSDKWKQINDDYAAENEIFQDAEEDDKEMFEQEQKNEDDL